MNASPAAITADAPARLPWLHRLSVASLVVTILLTIGIGGTITSTEVGMAYPTWPDINGGSLFNIFYGELADAFGTGSVIEHTHRQAGALAGFIVLLTAALAWLQRGVSKRVRWLATATLALVTVQGLIGALRVLENSYGGAILHALGAQAVVVVLVVQVRATSGAPRLVPAPADDRDATLRRWTTLALVLLFVNLFAAASLRHKQGAFPGHLVLAILTAVVLLAVMRLAFLAPVRRALHRDALRMSWVLGTQLALGVAAWAYLLGPLAEDFADEQLRFTVQAALATGHLLCGVLVMAVATSLWLEARAPEAR